MVFWDRNIGEHVFTLVAVAKAHPIPGGGRPMHRYSGRKGNWTPQYYDEILSLREEWRIEMRPRVLDAAARLLAEVGPRQFTVKEVARRARVSRTTIYKHIGIKAELLAACREHVGNRTGARVNGRANFHARRPLQDPARLKPMLARVRQVLLGLAAELEADSDLWLLAAGEGIRAKRRPPHGRGWEPPSPLPARLRQVIWRVVCEAQQVGDLPKGTDPDELALWLGALWWYAVSVRGPHRDHLPPHANLAGSLGTALAWLLRGAAA